MCHSFACCKVLWESQTKDDIIYSRDGNWLKLASNTMLKVLNEYFGRDKNAIYFRAGQIQHPSLDVSSFDTTSDAYTFLTGLDKNQYFLELYGNNNEKVRVRIVEHADPKTYVGVNYEWSKDRSNYFYKGTKFNITIASKTQRFTGLRQRDLKASFRIFRKYQWIITTFIGWYKYPPIAFHIRASYLKRVSDKYYVMSGVTTDNFSIVNDAYAKVVYCDGCRYFRITRFCNYR